MESSGPEGGKVRGPAAVIYERYLQAARDAASSGDRVLSENFLQHADHYFRLVRSMQPATPPQQQTQERVGDGAEAEGDDDTGAEAQSGDENESGDQPEVDFPEGQQPQHFDREEGSGGRRRRGRRSRYRPNSDGDGDEGGGGEGRESDERAAASEREERPRRERRERDEDQSGPEGFSNGPKPAFMRG